MTTMYPNFATAISDVGRQLAHAHRVRSETWQGVPADKPEMAMHEILNVSLQVPMPLSAFALENDIKPSMPWAKDHFKERVCGHPLNPGETWKTWPWGHSADKFRDSRGQFNHNYMERYWPKHAGQTPDGHLEHGTPTQPIRDEHVGIRAEPYGDLMDVVSLLFAEPHTRQAYLPIFFPQDTGNVNPGRKPCTLGYHFIMRGGYLHTTYYIRSCDFVRHFRDDIYLTARLALWVLDQLELNMMDKGGFDWTKVSPGFFVMHIVSLHCFANDIHQLRQEYA